MARHKATSANIIRVLAPKAKTIHAETVVSKAVRLRPFFSYYGSKWIMAPYYPLPEHDHIVEPFAGSACYALLYPSRKVTLCDSNPVITGIWRYLIATSEAEILALPDLLEGQTVRDLRNVCQEARHLIGFWIRKAQSRPGLSPSPWMRVDAWRGFWGAHARKRIALQLKAIRHWRVIEGSYQQVSQDYKATYFVDPPYVRGGQFYPHGSKRIDYSVLAKWCLGLPGQVIACEAEGATWLPFSPLRTVRSAASRGKVGRSREAIWTSSQTENAL